VKVAIHLHVPKFKVVELNLHFQYAYMVWCFIISFFALSVLEVQLSYADTRAASPMYDGNDVT
jgi:hypothetical protein